ncbi:MAG: hypothetical protein OEY59_06910 [Deltaproteobacteria bacterium]|nr:hypothetical protein [Deltaproteobacteria bacterium]
MGSKHFVVTEEQKREYAAGFILDLMQNRGFEYSVVLDGDDKYLEELFVYMMAKEYLDINKENKYTVTPKGFEKLDNLKKRYEEYLAHFDLFCAVDTESGEFAFEKIFELDDDEWEEYIDEDRFIDLRIAVSWFKKINPTDIVFLSFLKEGRFETDRHGWQFDLLSGLIWQQIEEIVDTAVPVEDLGYTTDEGEVICGEMVIEDIIKQGAKLSADLHAQEEHINQDKSNLPNDYYDDEGQGTYIVSTYESYYNPFYISPIWFMY